MFIGSQVQSVARASHDSCILHDGSCNLQCHVHGGRIVHIVATTCCHDVQLHLTAAFGTPDCLMPRDADHACRRSDANRRQWRATQQGSRRTMSAPGRRMPCAGNAWNKTAWRSALRLAAAGILACIAALLDNFVPQGSLLAFSPRWLPLGWRSLGVMVGFAWVCDKCEDLLERGPLASEPSRPAAKLAGSGRLAATDPRASSDRSRSLHAATSARTTAMSDRCADCAADAASRPRRRRTWHGQ